MDGLSMKDNMIIIAFMDKEKKFNKMDQIERAVMIIDIRMKLRKKFNREPIGKIIAVFELLSSTKESPNVEWTVKTLLYEWNHWFKIYCFADEVRHFIKEKKEIYAMDRVIQNVISKRKEND